MKIDNAVFRSVTAMLAVPPYRAGAMASEYVRITPVDDEHVLMSIGADVVCNQTVPCDGAWPFEDAVYLDRRVLQSFMGASDSEEPFDFLQSKSGPTLKQGKRRVVFASTQKLPGYGPVLDTKGFKSLKLSNEDLFALSVAAKSCSTDPAKTHVRYIRIQKGNVVSTNFVTIYLGKTRHSKASVSIPPFFVGLFSDGSEIQYSAENIVLVTPYGQLYQPLGEGAEDFPLPNTIKAIAAAEKANSAVIEASCDELLAALNRFSSYHKGDQATVTLSTAKNRLTVALTSRNQDAYTERVTASVKAADMNLQFLAEVLLPTLTTLLKSEDSISISYADGQPALFKCGTHVLAVCTFEN